MTFWEPIFAGLIGGVILCLVLQWYEARIGKD